MSDAALSLALSHLSAGRHAQARAALTRVLRGSPRHPQACAAMGLAFAREGRADQAAYYAGLARACAPGDADTLCNAANILNEVGRFDEAAGIFAEAARLATASVSAALRPARRRGRVRTRPSPGASP